MTVDPSRITRMHELIKFYSNSKFEESINLFRHLGKRFGPQKAAQNLALTTSCS